ncbi:MAG: extracellular solute-binding protein [Anaerolineae bacterium]|nr:extracellular solute-binding protein [Anaerolineae bacterium]
MHKWRVLTGLLALAVLIGFVPSAAAQSGVILQVVIPEFMADTITPELFAPFEQQTGTTVQIVQSSVQSLFTAPAANDVTTHLQSIADYVSAADVVFATSNNLSVEATRAGYYLDLAPLANGDSSLNSEDFYPAVYQSYQWDRGLWAIPVSTSVTTLSYDPAAFDAVGLAYPDPRWTLDDLANAARVLTERDSSGAVTTPGLMVSGDTLVALLLRSLLGEGFYDMSTVPEAPRLATPELESLLTAWNDLVTEGIISTGGTGDFSTVPMSLGFGFVRRGPGQDNDTSTDVILPGGHVGMDVQGFAVSKGTQYPEQAYELVKFLSNSAEAANNPFGIRPARQSLLGVPVDSAGNNGPGRGVFFGQNSQVTEALLDEALPAALGSSETRFSDYVALALQSMQSDGLDAHTALLDAEAAAVANLQTAADIGASTTITVAAPEVPVVLSAGEISLKFGYSSFFRFGELPNQDQWQAAIDNFVANDPEVGDIIFETTGGGGPRGLSSQSDAALYDCYIQSNNAVPTMDLSTVLNLDPFLNSDPSYDPNDMVSNIMTQVQRDNKTWALPITLTPQVLEYDPQAFARAGIPEPVGGWTIDEFVNALKALKVYPEDPTPFTPQDAGTSLLLLIAAFGGRPLDYSTNPPTANFTDPATVDAIRQVLDLAKQGYIGYSQQGNGFVIQVGGPGDTSPIRAQLFRGVQVFSSDPNAAVTSDYQITNYPTGTQYNAVSYSIATAYISATSQNPEACYRWISAIAHNPALIDGMPAIRSLITDPAVTASKSQETVDAYLQFDRILAEPNTITMADITQGAGLGSFVLNLWLNQVFDDYILNNGDLEADLAQAQIYADGYTQCVAALPPIDLSGTSDPREAFQQIADCATKVDPNFTSLFGGPGGG